MKYNKLDLESPIVALSTPWGESAIAAVRISGNESIDLLSKAFKGKKKLTEASGYSLNYGKLINPDNKKTVDEVIIGIYKKPKSYTGQDMAEIFCHGNMTVVSEIINMLIQIGFRNANRGEFTLRAFLNGKLDLTRAEAVNEIIKSNSPKGISMSLERLSGSLFNRINSIKINLMEVLAELELQLDYAEDEADPQAGISIEKIEDAREKLLEIASTYRIGKTVRDGIKVVLAGRTNAGKSSLFNLFNKTERAIVSEHHGTTRDFIESFIIIDGISVKLYDTAGLRISENSIEAEGIKRSRQLIDNADIILYIVDGSVGLDSEDEKTLLELPEKKVIKIWNKADLPVKEAPENFVKISSADGSGFAVLEQEIIKLSGLAEIELTGDTVIESDRQKKLVDDAIESLENALSSINADMPLDVIAPDIKQGLDNLGEITGEVTTADILEVMFSKFCVGK